MKKQILNIITYFDIFRYPIKKEELITLLKAEKNQLDLFLNELISENICFKEDNYFSIQKEISPLIKERILKENNAKKYIQKIPFFVKIMKRFPFVRGIAISGSLSKGVMYKKGDIDYFIITAPNRLWITRTFLILFKKIFLLNSRKHFCVNYFVDENNLEIKDKNIFTAIEVSYLNPVYNNTLINKLKQTNNWSEQYIPNSIRVFETTEINTKSNVRNFSEWIFKGALGEILDKYFMKITLKRWENKFSHFNKEKFELTMRTNRGISKHHPQDFQNKVLKEFSSRIKAKTEALTIQERIKEKA